MSKSKKVTPSNEKPKPVTYHFRVTVTPGHGEVVTFDLYKATASEAISEAHDKVYKDPKVHSILDTECTLIPKPEHKRANQ